MKSDFDKKTEKKKPKSETKVEPSLGKEILDYVIMIAVVVAVVVVINHVFLINARIPSSSMEDTIMVNDRVFGNRLAYVKNDPKRFDIIIFKYPDDESTYFIKRIIGLPGDTVNIVDGKVYINNSDKPLDDSFCPEPPVGSYGPYKVPADSYFVLGDNRNNSHDSRFWVHTYVTKDEILGKAELRYWPLNKIGPVK